MMFDIVIDRDSVCMADDIDSHEKTIQIDQPLKLSDLIEEVLNLRFLPYISGGKAVWAIKYKSKPLAVIQLTDYGSKVSKVKTKFFVGNPELTELLKYDLEKKISFGYYAQENYNNVFKKLKDEKYY